MDFILSLFRANSGNSREVAPHTWTFAYLTFIPANMLTQTTTGLYLSLYVPVFHVDIATFGTLDMVTNLIGMPLALWSSTISDSIKAKFGCRRFLVIFGLILFILQSRMLARSLSTSANRSTIFGANSHIHSENDGKSKIIETNCTLVKMKLEQKLGDKDLKKIPTAHASPSDGAPVRINEDYSILVWLAVANVIRVLGSTVAKNAFNAMLIDQQFDLKSNTGVLTLEYGLTMATQFLIQPLIVYLTTAYSDDMMLQASIVMTSAFPLQIVSCLLFMLTAEKSSAVLPETNHASLGMFRQTMKFNHLFRHILGQHTVHLLYNLSVYRNLEPQTPGLHVPSLLVAFLLLTRIERLASTVSSSVFTLFIQNILRVENSKRMISALSLLQQVVAVLSFPLVGRLFLKLGPINALRAHATFDMHRIVLSLVPPDLILRWNLLPLTVVCSTIFDAISHNANPTLVIDVCTYDRLIFGLNRSSMVPSMIEQVIGVVGMVIHNAPMIAISQLGYLPNSGCLCGCGAPCPSPHMRWSCPGDVGHACRNDLSRSNPPFFGDVHRIPPCTFQSADVTFFVKVCFFYFGIPCSLAFLALLSSYPVDTQLLRDELVSQASARMCGRVAYDPLFYRIVDPTERTDRGVLETFGEEERQMAMIDKLGVWHLIYSNTSLAILCFCVILFSCTVGAKYVDLNVTAPVSAMLVFVALWFAVKASIAYTSRQTLQMLLNLQVMEASSGSGHESSTCSGWRKFSVFARHKIDKWKKRTNDKQLSNNTTHLRHRMSL